MRGVGADAGGGADGTGRRAGRWPPPMARGCAAGRWRSSAATGWRRCSRSWACTRSTAARRSTPPPTTCWRRSTRCRPRRWWCCRTAPNVIMAAEHAAELSDKQVLVAPATSQQAGLAAAVALEPDRTVRGERAGAERGARASAHGGGRAGGARRRAGTLRARRGGRVRGGRGGRMGRSRRDPAGGPGGARRRRGADQRARGSRTLRWSPGTSPGCSTAGSSSSCATAVSPPTGGCWPRSDDRRRGA